MLRDALARSRHCRLGAKDADADWRSAWPWLFGTIGVGKQPDGAITTTAFKGLAIKVGEHGEAAVAYDLDLCRMVGAWTGKFVTPMNLMSRGEYPSAMGEVAFTTGEVPGFQLSELGAARSRGGVEEGELAAFNAELGQLRKQFASERSPKVGKRLAGLEKAVAAWFSDAELAAPPWKDPRLEPFGPLPIGQPRFKGMNVNGGKTILKWDIGGTELLETPGYQLAAGHPEFSRRFTIPTNRRLTIVLAKQPGTLVGSGLLSASHWGNVIDGPVRTKAVEYFAFENGAETTVATFGSIGSEKHVALQDGTLTFSLLTVPEPKDFRGSGDEHVGDFEIRLWCGTGGSVADYLKTLERTPIGGTDVRELTRRPVPHGDQPVVTTGEVSKDATSAYVVDTIKLPDPNPWAAPMFLGGFDFFPDGRAAVCTFHGDVFIVSGIDEKLEHVSWRRFASGLYHALGLKIVNGEIYVACRDGITRLRDLNGDGEADFYERFNNDLKVTKSFHEFVFDLQTDPAGNFYFSKAGPVKNGGRGFDEIMSQHGTLMRVSPDGAKLDVIATGFRAPNGIGVGPHGELTSGDNEGTWTPACKINWIKPGGFYGVVDLAHRTPAPTSYNAPLCWLPKRVDNSGGGQVWVPAGDRWGPWSGKLLHLSYGQSSLFGVLAENIEHPGSDAGQLTMQGGVAKFPLQFQSGIMRARFNPKDGQLYVCGLRGWQTNGLKNGCFQRVRYTGAVPRMPIEMHVQKGGIELRFACSLDTAAASDPENWHLEQWRYHWSSAYGSPELSTAEPTAAPGELGKDGRAEFSTAQMQKPQHDAVTVKSVAIGTDDRSVFLEIPELKPVMQMSIKYDLKSADGAELRGEVVNTIHAVPAG